MDNKIDYTDTRWIDYHRDLRRLQNDYGKQITPELSVRIGRIGDTAEKIARDKGDMEVFRYAINSMELVIRSALS